MASDCICRPSWPGHTCTTFTPAEQALTDHLNTYGSTVLYDAEIKEAVAVVEPHVTRRNAEALRALGHTDAARALERGLEDIDLEGDTE